MLTTITTGGINMKKEMTFAPATIASMVKLDKNFKYNDMLIYYTGYMDDEYVQSFIQYDDGVYVCEKRFKVDILIFKENEIVYKEDLYHYNDETGGHYIYNDKEEFNKDPKQYIQKLVDLIIVGGNIW